MFFCRSVRGLHRALSALPGVLTLVGCATTTTLPPALPDEVHGFSSAWFDETPGFPSLEQLHPPPPAIVDRPWVREAPVPLVVPPSRRQQRQAARERRRSPAQVIAEANAGAMIGPTREAYWHNESAILNYRYEIGKLYDITSSVKGPTLIQLPIGQRLAAAPMLHTGGEDPDWEFKAVEMGEGATRREAVILRPFKPGLSALMPLVTVQGLTFLCKLTSQEKIAMAQVTWEMEPTPSAKGFEPTPAQRETDSAPSGLVMSAYPAKARAVVPEQGALKAPVIALDRLHTAYTIEVTSKVKPPWVPQMVFDDGRQTVVKFKEPLTYTDAPVVLGVYADGSPALIEFSTYTDPAHPERGLWYLVAGLYPRLVLKGADHLTVRITRVATP
jgi:type IV secretory pathway VirB9-like protein